MLLHYRIRDQGVHEILCFFLKFFVIFLNSASSAAALVFYLPGVCTYTDTEGKQSPEYFLKFGKSTIFNEHPVFILQWFVKKSRTDKE